MTTQVQTPFNESIANGVTKVFPFSFKLSLTSDLIVQFNGVTQSSGFSITGLNVDSGGNVTFVTAPASGTIVLLKRELPLKRDTDYQNNGDLLADIIDNDFDRIWQAIQQFGQLLKATVKLPFNTSSEQILNETAASRANNLLGFDAFGNVALKLLANFATTPVSSFFASLLNLPDALSVRAAIGSNPAIYTATTTGTSSAYLAEFSPALVDYSNNPLFKITFDKACADNATIQMSAINPPLNLKIEASDGQYVNVAAGDILPNHTTLGLLINNNTDLLIEPATSIENLLSVVNNTTFTLLTTLDRTITSNGTNLVHNLPLVSELPTGASFRILSESNNCTIQGQVANNIKLNGSSVSLVIINKGGIIDFVNNGTQWLAVVVSLGYSQTWQLMGATRVLGTTYTNNTGVTIKISVINNSATTMSLTVGGIVIASEGAPSGSVCTLFAEVPNGATYSAANGSIQAWNELR